MSGGSHLYAFKNLSIYTGDLEDKKLEQLLIDFQALLKELEWYRSGDTDKNDYHTAVKKFKKKWLKEAK